MWTEQTVETLKKLAREGRSAAWIAAALGAPSRSAVIGKASRIGIKLNGAMRSPPVEDESGSRRQQPTNSLLGHALSRPRGRALAIPGQERCSDRWTIATAEVGEMRRIGFTEIGEAECRWPLGDPAQEDFAYCGLQVAKGHAYCAGHCRLVYR